MMKENQLDKCAVDVNPAVLKELIPDYY